MLAVFAEFEREQIVERVRAGLATAKRNGTKSGRPIGRPRVVPPEIEALIADQYKAGNSFAAIAKALTQEGIPSPEGNTNWQTSTVRRIYNRSES
jgi:DNA invertase Pin-like site-specific DNA recombinase